MTSSIFELVSVRGRCNDGKRAPVLDITGSAEETLGTLQGIGVDSTRQGFLPEAGDTVL